MPKCGLSGQVIQTSAGTGVARYLTESLSNRHTEAEAHRNISGATPAQWQVMYRNKRTTRSVDGLVAKFGEADVPPPHRDILRRFQQDVPVVGNIFLRT